MCFGGGGGNDKLAKQAAEQEQQRQDRIAQGMRELEVMFSGGTRGKGKVGREAAYDPNAAYYDRMGNAIKLMDPAAWRAAQQKQKQKGGSLTSLRDARQYHPNAPNTAEQSGGSTWQSGLRSWERGDSGQGSMTLEQQRAAQEAADRTTMQEQFGELAKQGLYAGTEQVQGFDPNYFNKAYQAQLDYALPQVDKQYADAQKQLAFALARQGISASSQAGQLQSELQGQRNLALQGEQDKATQVRSRQQQAVEDERAELTRLLQQTGDVQSTMNMAAARRNMLQAAPAMETVGPLFQNATGALADMIVSPAMRGGLQPGGGGYSRPSRGSGKVVT